MERVCGGELFDLLKTRQYFSEFESCYIMYHLLIALQYLHNCGIMHRDIKPENVLLELTSDKQRIVTLKVIDFGLACMFRSGELIYDPCGTPAYVAPEILRNEGYNAKVDMWSSGVIAYLLY